MTPSVAYLRIDDGLKVCFTKANPCNTSNPITSQRHEQSQPDLQTHTRSPLDDVFCVHRSLRKGYHLRRQQLCCPSEEERARLAYPSAKVCLSQDQVTHERDSVQFILSAYQRPKSHGLVAVEQSILGWHAEATLHRTTGREPPADPMTLNQPRSADGRDCELLHSTNTLFLRSHSPST